MRSSLKKKSVELLTKLPSGIKGPLIRRLVRFPSEIDTSLRFKVAETKDELTQAYALLYESYLKEGLMKPHPSGLRVTKYHALPSTSTLIALEGQSVVGTLSLIRQSSFGTPLESIFELKGLPSGSRVAEVSSLAIRGDRQRLGGKILFPLLKFLYHYATDYFGVTHFVIAVNPKWYDFYESILLFKRLSAKVVDNYNFVNGVPAIGGVLDLKWAQKAYAQVYGNQKQEKSLYHFFTEMEGRNFELPIRKKGVLSDPVLTPDLMEYFFVKQTNIFDELNDFELMCLRELYHKSCFLELIPRPSVLKFKTRKDKRFETRLRARIWLDQHQSVPFEIASSSSFGIGGLIKADLKPGIYHFLVDLDDHDPCQMRGELLWRKESGMVGVRLVDPPLQWIQFIRALNNRLLLDSDSSEAPTEANFVVKTKVG